MSSRRTVTFTAPQAVEITESPIPDPAPDEVRVRTAVSAISPGTELLVYRGDAPSDMPADIGIEALSGDLSFPLSYGYAAVGEVTATGDDVPDTWHGRSVFAFRPHTSHFVCSPDELIPVPELRPSTAAFIPTAETAVNFLMDGRPMLGERVAVFGQGVVGLLTTALLATYPLSEIVAIEPRESRRDLAKRFGADRVLDPEVVDVPTALGTTDLTNESESGTDLTYEVSGQPAALDDAIAATGYGGRVIVGSWYGRKRADLDLGGRFHRSRIRIVSSQVSTIAPEHRGRWDTARRLETTRSRLSTIDTEPLVTDRIPVEDAATAYRRLDESEPGALCFLFTYD